jgi:hypothetical protein
MNRPEFEGPGGWATDLQHPDPVFGLPVKGCDLLLRGRNGSLSAPFQGTRLSKGLVFSG